jgi:uncharacterized phiE125 gp8 family phage protein
MTWPPTGLSTWPSVLAPWVRVVEAAPTDEPLTLDEAKLRAGLDWTVGDPMDALMGSFISAARAYVEQRIARAIPVQTHEVFYDGAGVVVGTLLVVPGTSQPLASVEAVTSTDSAGTEHALDPAAYVVQRGRGLIQLVGPLPTDVQAIEGWRVDLTCGAATIDPELLQVVGLLVAHYATLGRDLASITPAMQIPQGFEEAITPFLPTVIP